MLLAQPASQTLYSPGIMAGIMTNIYFTNIEKLVILWYSKNKRNILFKINMFYCVL